MLGLIIGLANAPLCYLIVVASGTSRAFFGVYGNLYLNAGLIVVSLPPAIWVFKRFGRAACIRYVLMATLAPILLGIGSFVLMLALGPGQGFC